MNKYPLTVNRWSRSLALSLLTVGLGVVLWASAPAAHAQVGLSLSGPSDAANCGTVELTNHFINEGTTVSGLMITNDLPSDSYAYIPGLSTVTLPSGAVLTGAAADPDVNNNSTNLVWDFSGVVTPSTVTNLLVTEVYYNATQTPEEDNEWFEIYNPTTNAVTLTGWSVQDAAPGAIDGLPTFTIAPGEFVVIAGRTNAFLTANPAYAGQVFEVADGKIGSGLNNFGDGVILRDSSINWVDAVSYGASTAAFSPSVPGVAAGHSIARDPADNDTNTRNDWTDQAVPDPGTGVLPVGIQNGGEIILTFAVEINCAAISGQSFTRAGFEQPPGTPATETGSAFLTVHTPDLVVTKTPIIQNAGLLDTVSWTVRVENAGFGGAVNVEALDRLGPGMVFTGFSIPPSTLTASNATWDATAIPAFTNLAAQASVDIVVTAQVVSCEGLYNQADATWGCTDLSVLPNEICEDTADRDETATAGIYFIDRYPELSYAVEPLPMEVEYCGGSDFTMYITNASGADVGIADNIEGVPILPDGWAISGASLDTNGVVQVGSLLPGASTSVVVHVEATNCPIDLSEKPVFLRMTYTDGCGNPFFGSLLSTTARVVNEPRASVTKIMPSSVSGDMGSFPVRVELSYTNFDGSESITVTDLFPVHTNLTVANISTGGSQVGNTVVWNLTPGAGSGVVASSFDMVFGTPCGGPRSLRVNEVQATDYVDCQGCSQTVEGDGYQFPIQFNLGAGCPNPGLTGGCDFVSAKGVFPTLTEVCDPVMVTHTFGAFSGTLGDWAGVTFDSDLAGGTGFVDTTNEVTVLIDGSNVTSYVSFTQTSPNLVLDLSGLNGSSFTNLATITNSLVIAWPVSVSVAGAYTDDSSLLVPGCGTEEDWVSWNVGESRMEIELEPIFSLASCASSTGRIDLAMLPSPEGVSGEVRLFPAYDTEVVLDLDHDGDTVAGVEYIPGSTVFSNLVDLTGTPIAAFEPVISGDQLTWALGDLGTNENMSISYQLRPGCESDSNGLARAEVLYNVLCDDGTSPQLQSDVSQTNGAPYFSQAHIINDLQPELQFLTDTQIVNQVRILNTSVVDAYNLRAEMVLPSNVSFSGAEIVPTTVTATNVVWEFDTLAGPFGPLVDADGDGQYDDLTPGEVLEFWVTNNLDSCTGDDELVLRSSFGCLGSTCQLTEDSVGLFVAISGSLVTRATFPVENALCEVNPVSYSVRNSGLTVDYDVQAFQTLPAGMDYVPGSSEVSINGGTTNSIGDPPGTGLPGDPLTWTSAQIPLLAAMQPNDEVSIYYDVALGCDAASGNQQFLSEGQFTDVCGNIVSNREVISVLTPDEPLLVVDKSSSIDVADLGETVVYTVTISHDAQSAGDVPYLALTDALPSAIAFGGASVAPDAVIGQTLIWSNATLNALTGDGVPPFARSEGAISIMITGTVVDCEASVINQASVDYGCSETDACLNAGDSVSIITAPILSPPGLVSEMALTTCGGTKSVAVTNSGASTASGIVYTEYAPPGYIFTGATSSGEFTSAGLIFTPGGTPLGSIATVDFSTDVSSGATDAKDDIGNGLSNLELGKNSAFTVNWTLASAGENLDCLADPTDLDYEDPDQGPPTSLTSSNRLDFTTLCGEADFALGSVSAYPGIPNLDIDLQPNSLIVTNGEVVSFTLSVINSSETEDADNIHVRVKMGEGWNALTYVSSNIVSSGTTSMLMEQQGNTNFLFDFPGVILNPLNDEILVTFTATVTQNGGPLTALAEVVGDCDNPLIIPQCTFTNVWGDAPLADTMAGPTLGPVNGQYSSFDQDRFVAAGHSLTKTVRYDEELAAAAGSNRTARVGEDLVYRIEALYFGGDFTDVTVTDSLPPELGFGTPVNYVFSGGITGAVWDAVSGVFTLQPTGLTTNPSTFAVDIPVVVSNRLDVQDGVIITNAATTAFTLDGVTNVPVEQLTEVEVLEPVLQITKTVNSNLVQAGDILIFTNRLVHTGASATSAYSIVFTDTLPAGLVFDSFISPASGTVAGQTISFNTNDLAALGEFKTNDPAIEFVFSVLVEDQLVGSTITNVSSATYVSLDNPSENGNERDGSDGVGGLNDYVTSSPVTLQSESIGNLTKTFVSSTQTNTLDGATNDWTIGERFVYQIRVDVPQGVVDNFVLTDVVPPGIDWVGTNPDAAMAYPARGYEFEIPAGGPQFPTNIADGLVISDPDPTPDDSTTNDGSGDDIAFTFASITNAADGNSANDYFLLRMEFVALDQGANVGILPSPLLSNNVARAQDAFTTQGATGPVYRIVEHDVRAQKTRNLPIVDAGDTMTFTLVVSNQPNALANAYDVLVTDTLSSNVYDVSTFTLVSVSPGWTTSLTGIPGGRLFEMASVGDTALVPGGAATSVFTVVIAQTVQPNQIYTNHMNVTESSTLYGPPPGGIVERDDTATDPVTFRAANFDISKSLVATSETGPVDSTGADLQIGEVATFEIAVGLPEGTITDLEVRDFVPDGLAYVVGSMQVLTGDIVGTLAPVTNLTPNTGPLGSDGEDVVITWVGDTVLTPTPNLSSNTLRLRLDAVVLDVPANVGLVPQTVLTNSASVDYAGNPNPPVVEEAPPVTLVEPDLDIIKILSPDSGDAGDQITVMLMATNSGLATAYDLDVSDLLDGAVFDTGSVANVSMPAGFTFALAPSGSDMTVTYASDTVASSQPTNSLEVGESLTFVFTVDLAQTVEPGAIYTNGVTLLTDTIYETNSVGIQRPYTNTAQDALTISNMVVAKALTGTSETGPADTTGSDVTIGEVASYRLTVTLPEATITNLAVADVIPPGMSYVAGSVSVDTTGFGGSLPGAPVVATSGGSGDDVTFTFQGLTVVTDDNNGANNSFAIDLSLLVLDVPGNDGLPPAVDGDGQTVLPNSATVAYDGNPPVSTSSVVNVDVVEPRLAITKTMGAASNSFVLVDLTVTNRGLSTAFDVEIQDVLPTTWWDTTTITPVTVPTGFTFATAGAPGDATITIATDGSSGQPTNAIEVGETLLFQFRAQLVDGAPSPVTNTAVVTEHSTIDGPNPDERIEPPVEDEDVLDIPGYELTKVRTSPLGRSAAVGETVTFDLIVANTGDIGLDPVLLEDTYDTTYLSYVSALPASEDTVNDGIINWTNVGPVAVGQAVTVAVEFVAIESTLPGDTTNRVVATPFTTNGLPLLPKTNEAPVEVVYVGYTLDKTNTNPGPTNAAQVGDPIEFTITVVNTGEVALATVPVEDTYDTTYLSYVSSLPASDDNTDDGTINWADIGPLPVGASTTIVATFTAAASTLSLPETNTVVTTPTTPPTAPPVPPKTNEAPYEVSSAGYTLDKVRTSPPGRPAIIGEAVTFDILVTNTGEVELVTVPVEDTYETAFLSYVSSLPASDDNGDDGTIHWADIGPLPVGASTTIVATFTAVADTLGADHTNTVVTMPTTPPDEPNVPPKTNDAPYQVDTAASLGDFVWLDVNGDGIQDAGEPGITNVLVTLYDADTNVLDTTATDASGLYAFTNLVPGTYFVGFTPPMGYYLTLQNQGTDDALDSDADPATGYTVPTVLSSGENDPTWDAGLYEPASLGDFVWDDLNADGIQDLGEVGVSNVVVTLYDTNAVVVGVTTTDVNGAYAFTNLPPAGYVVEVAPPPGYDISPQNQGGDDAVDSDIDPVTGQTTTISLESAEYDPTWDAGIYLPASLGDFVWLDINGDGIQDAGEPGITNVLVTLYDADTNALDTTTTDASGLYAFTNLVPGTYFVGFTPPMGYQITLQNQGGDDTIDSDADQTTGYTAPTVLISGENDPTWDAGLYQPASLGDFVWDDLNGDGIQDGGEPGIQSIVVNLYDADSNLLSTTATDGFGAYAFTNLPPGEYSLVFTRPAGYQFTLQNQGGDPALDSDADPTTGATVSTVLLSGENDPTWDAGLYRPASLGNYVWLDENWDGIQDPGEAGIPNVTVELLDSALVVTDTTVTDLNGLYLFTDLPPGTYTVRVDTPTLAPELAANPTYDLDGTLDSETSVPLASGDEDLRLDFGYNWSPPGPLLGAIGDRVWIDDDADGLQDPGEPGLSNVVVNLYIDSEGNGSYTTLVATTTTDAAGLYIFPNLDANSYVVQIDTNTLPVGFAQSGDPDHFGADASTNPTEAGDNMTTTPVILAPGDVFVNADFGYWPAASSALGDLIYFDANADGAFNLADGDYGIPGVTVVLLDANGLVIASTVTDGGSTNNYLFTGLQAGTYTVWVNDTANVLDSLVQTGDPDGGMDSRSTTTLDGVNDDLVQDHGYTPDRQTPVLGLIGDTIFLDRDGDGLPGAGEGIQGVTVYLFDSAGTTLLETTATDPNGHYYFGGLQSDTYVVKVDVTSLPNGGAGLVNTVDPDSPNPGDSESSVTIGPGGIDLDQDFGYMASVPNTIGGTLWRDCNADGTLDPDESTRWPGVGVVLRDTLGRIVGSMLTDTNGDYSFTELPDGAYSVDVVDVANVVNGFWLSIGPNPGMDNNSQSDPYSVAVSGGETNTTGDFGYYLVTSELGDYVWYDINENGIQDGGEPGLSSVRVSLHIAYPNGEEINMETYTDSNGRYRFANLLVDERYRAATTNDPAVAGLPRFTVSIVATQEMLAADSYEPTDVDMGDGTNDSRSVTGTFAELAKCGRPVIYDFGFKGGPLLAVIGNVEAFTRDGQTVVQWETIESWNTAGFYLERQIGEDWSRISPSLIPYPIFGVTPIVYEEIDPTAEAGGTYLYRLIELETDGNERPYGPYELTVDGPGRTYADWAEANFTPEELADPSISGEDADPDGDGLTNGQEFLAGTDPTRADSVLQVTRISKENEGMQLHWKSVAGRSYRVAVSDSMFGPFLPLQDEILATDSEISVTLPVAFTNRQLYFQVILVSQ